jgi:hypothetical protein
MTDRMDDIETTAGRSGRNRVLEVLLGAVTMAVGLVVVGYAGAHGFIEPTLAHRLRGVIVGVFLVVTGNSIPKNRGCGAEVACSPVRDPSFQRFAGWTYVLGGLGYTISYLALPIERAETVGMVFIGATIALVLPRLLWTALKRRPSQPVGS